MQLLASVKDPTAIASGIFLSTVENQDALWRDSLNVWFGDGSAEFHRAYANSALPAPGAVWGMAEGSVSGVQVYYLGTGTMVYRWNPLFPTIFTPVLDNGSVWDVGPDSLTGGIVRRWSIMPWGQDLMVADGQHQLRYFNSNSGVCTPVGNPTLTQAEILGKLGNHILAYNTNNSTREVRWSDTSAPTVWAPTTANRAGGITVRELDGPIKAAVALGNDYAFYSTNSMGITSFIGGNDVFSNTVRLNGFGVLGKNSVIPVGKLNYGVGHKGFWKTDGFDYQPIDTPQVNRYFQSRTDFSSAGQAFAFGFHDARRRTLYWTFRDGTDNTQFFTLGYAYDTGAWMKLELPITAGVEAGGNQFPYVAARTSFGPFGNSGKAGDNFIPSSLRSGFMALGDASTYKLWDKMEFFGDFSSAVQVRFGFAEMPDADLVEWTDPVDIAAEVWIGRESPVFQFEIISPAAQGDNFRLGGFAIYGEKGGFRR